MAVLKTNIIHLKKPELYRMIKSRKYSVTIILILILYTSVSSQEQRKIEITAQGILARVDNIMKYPQGQLKGVIKHIRPDGKSYVIDLSGYVSGDDCLFKFSSSERGDQIKILYNMKGEDIWVYNILAIRLYHKLGIDKFDPILATNFAYLDLSNAELQTNYTATIEGDAFIRGFDSYKIILRPIFKTSEYGQLTLFVTKDKFIPLRIDYHDRDKVIFKFLTIAKTMEKDGRILPIRYDMMDIRQGTVSIISFTAFDNAVKLDRSMFRSERLGE